MRFLATRIAQLIDSDQDRTLWRLILALAKLGDIIEGLCLLVANKEEFDHWLELPLITSSPSAARQATTLSARAPSPLQIPCSGEHGPVEAKSAAGRSGSFPEVSYTEES